MANWNQPQCEACWIDQNTYLDPERGVVVRVPYLLRQPRPEQCAWCGTDTIIGLYVRADPNEVPYPAPDDLPDTGELPQQ